MITGDMGAARTEASPPREPLRRNSSRRVVAGVCAGLGRHFGVDPLIARIAFVALATAGGMGIVLYALAWIIVPAEGSESAPAERKGHGQGRGSIEVAIGMGLIVVSLLLTARALGLFFSDVIVWPTALVAAGAALLWRQSLGPTPVEAPEQPAPEEERRERARVLSR